MGTLLEWLRKRVQLVTQPRAIKEMVSFSLFEWLLSAVFILIAFIVFWITENVILALAMFVSSQIISSSVFMWRKWKNPKYFDWYLSDPDWFFWNWDKTTWMVLGIGIVVIFILAVFLLLTAPR